MKAQGQWGTVEEGIDTAACQVSNTAGWSDQRQHRVKAALMFQFVSHSVQRPLHG